MASQTATNASQPLYYLNKFIHFLFKITNESIYVSLSMFFYIIDVS